MGGLACGALGQWPGHWLFLLIVLLGAVVAALFANDGAVLILTPLVFEMLRALRFTPAATLAFIMATDLSRTPPACP